MLAWEIEEPKNLQVHHLTVLCYYLQHPALYSPEGLQHGRSLLKKFVVHNEKPQVIRQQAKSTLASDKRTWKIKGTADSHGTYSPPIKWQMTAADIIESGIENYIQNIHRWSRLIYDQLQIHSKLPGSCS
jgi:hypothetical protein